MLEDRGHKVKWVDEGINHHPADFEFHTYLTEKDLEQFSSIDKNVIVKSSVKEHEGYIIQ